MEKMAKYGIDGDKKESTAPPLATAIPSSLEPLSDK